MRFRTVGFNAALRDLVNWWDPNWRLCEDGLRSLESRVTTEEALGDRLAVPCTVDTSISGTSATAITGVTDTVTPAVDCRAVITGALSSTVSVFGSATNSFLIGELTVNGATQTPVIWNQVMGTGSRFISGQTWTVNLTAGVAYTFVLNGRVNTAGNTYVVRASHSFIQVRLGRRL